jgi:CheY-like chemotaxis protein
VFLIALTGWGHDSDKRLSREAGFDAHLVKPADVASIEQLLQASARGPSAAH